MHLNHYFTVKNFSKTDFNNYCSDWRKIYTQYSINVSSPFKFLELVPNPNSISSDDPYIYQDKIAEIGAKFVLNKCHHNNFNFDVFVYNGDLHISKSTFYYGQYVGSSLLKEVQKQIMPIASNLKTLSYKEWSNTQSFGGNIYAENNYKKDKVELYKLGLDV